MDNKEKAQLTWEILQRRKRRREAKKEEAANKYLFDTLDKIKEKTKRW